MPCARIPYYPTQVCDIGVTISHRVWFRHGPVTLSGPQRVSSRAFGEPLERDTTPLLAGENTAGIAGPISVPSGACQRMKPTQKKTDRKGIRGHPDDMVGVPESTYT